jgi:serine/threonine-protein kinase
MGEVWLAKHQLLARPVAVKLIRPDVAVSSEHGQTMVQRFQREAQATAALNSPNTIRLYDFGVSEAGSFYLVMELLNGFDLDSLVGRFGPMHPERAVMLLRQICRSLSEAHASGLIHRDIKPANIFVCKMGSEFDFLKVLDFGIVKEIGSEFDTQLTMAGNYLGTPAFMAPESSRGGEVDHRSDLFGVGCVAYWLLTGRPPFDSHDAMRNLEHSVKFEIAPPSEASPFDFPQSLDRLVLSCLKETPSERPISADELWELLGEIEFEEQWTHARAKSWWMTNVPIEESKRFSDPFQSDSQSRSIEITRTE